MILRPVHALGNQVYRHHGAVRVESQMFDPLRRGAAGGEQRTQATRAGAFLADQ